MGNLYSYIGTFDITSGVIDIADPYINSIIVAIERIPYLNEKMVKIRGALCGNYEAYHVIDNNTEEIKGLLAIHCTCDISDLKNENKVSGLGFASSALSSAIVLVDEAYRFDTRYCYNPLERDAYYDGKVILKELPNMPYDENIKIKLETKVKEILAQEEIIHPSGSDILDVIGDYPIWPGFRNFKLCSSQWSVDIINRLNNSFTNGVCIKGGVISTSPGGYLSCYNYRNHRGDTYAVYISLNTSFGLNTNVFDNTNIPNFTYI